MDKSVTILIIDDKATNIFALEKLLEKAKRNFISATNGKDGLKMALTQNIDLIILDVQMPEMDGFEVARLLKSNKRTKEIPIIFASAEKKERQSIMQGFDEGAVDYLSKPLDPELTRAKVSVLLTIQLQKRDLLEKNQALVEAKECIKANNEELATLNEELTASNEELHTTNEQLVAVNQQLEIANKTIEKQSMEIAENLKREKELAQIKTRFVSLASHEFRTPLSTISIVSGYIRKFKERMSSGDIDKKLETVDAQIKHMTALLDDVLTIGKSEDGKINVKLEDVNIKVFFENLVQEIFDSSKGSNCINLRLTPSPKNIQSDVGLLRNIFINLLVNAVKFSPGGKEIDLSVVSRETEIEISVRDFGLGIPPEDLERLFDPFFRAQNVISIAGTGLGLSIVKRAVELLKGNISVKSKLNEGTEFIVILPFNLN